MSITTAMGEDTVSIWHFSTLGFSSPCQEIYGLNEPPGRPQTQFSSEGRIPTHYLPALSTHGRVTVKVRQGPMQGGGSARSYLPTYNSTSTPILCGLILNIYQSGREHEWHPPDHTSTYVKVPNQANNLLNQIGVLAS